MGNLNDILKRHGLKSTEIRKDILKCFKEEHSAVSQWDIDHALDGRADRVTIYRNLKIFVEKGLIHKIPDENGVVYALCQDNCHDGNHKDDHVHFKCSNCLKTLCFENYDLPKIRLPEGYQKSGVDVLVHGLCPKCRD